MSLFSWKTSISPQEELLKYFKEQEELKCDPLYLAVTLGNVHLLYLRLSQQHEEEAKKFSLSGKQPTPLKGIKISFKEDSTVKIEEPGFLSQSLPRTFSGEGRVELGLIRPHLVKFLQWFDFQKPSYQTIIKLCKLGIEDILKGYKNQSQEIIITQNSPSKESERFERTNPLVIKIQTHTPETDFVIRILENDIALLEEALKKKEDRALQEFKQKLFFEEMKYFPLNKLRLIKVSKSIDDYMAEKVRARWDDQTLQGIVKFFEATAITTESFNHHDSLALLISRNPPVHQLLKIEIRDLILSTTPNCKLDFGH